MAPELHLAIAVIDFRIDQDQDIAKLKADIAALKIVLSLSDVKQDNNALGVKPRPQVLPYGVKL